MNEISVTATSGPTAYSSDNQIISKYIAIGVKYSADTDDNTIDNITDDELLTLMLVRIKNEILKLKEQTLEEKNDSSEFNSGIISLTDKFFDYIKNNETKIQAIRVSLNDYDQDHKEQKLRTLKTKMMVITADEQSMDDTFDTIVKQLYYEFGDTVIDLYSIILTPKMYKIINNIPVEYRGVLIRVKK